MQRPIKFRVWDTKTNKFREDITPIEAWLDSDSWDDPEELRNDPYLWQMPETFNGRLIWQQYMGEKDKNGKEIFEGDIISLVNADGIAIRVLCEFGTARRNIGDNLLDITGFYFKHESGFKSFPIVENYLGKHDLELFEVVGNIYETPELFKSIYI